MKAVVVSPSICDFYFTPGRAAALGAYFLNDILIEQGIDSTFLNLPLMKPRGKKIPLPNSHSYLEQYIVPGEKGPVTYFNSFKRFGPSIEESSEIILSKKPDIIFISLFAWAYAEDAILLAQELKRICQKVNICIGGPGVTVLPKYFKEKIFFDYVLTGDAEIAVPSLIKSFNDKKEVICGFNVNDPEPVVSLNIDSKGNQWISMILSRGCPLKCKFCSNHLTQGRVFRKCSIKNLETKFKTLDISNDYPLHITLEDDNLLIRKSYFKDVLIMIKKMFPNATFSIDNGLDYTYLNNEYLMFLIDIGFNSFTFSLGTFNRNILEIEERPSDFKRFEEILDILKDNSIPVSTFLICGLPDDSSSNVLNSLVYLNSLNTNIGMSLFYTVPGLPRFENTDIFLNKSSRLCCGAAAYPWGKSLSTKELITLFRLSRLSNFIKKENKTVVEIDLITKIKSEKKLYTLQGKSNQIVEVKNLDNKLILNFLNYVFS